MEYVLVALASYLMGSFPTAAVLARLAKGIDIRKHGSGNPGAANALRVLGPVAFVVVFLGDFLKGFLPVLLAASLLGDPLALVLAGLCALAGHTWSIFLNFSGGRGVVTGVAALFAMAPLVAAVVTLTTVSVILLSRYVSLGSMIGAAVALPLTAVWVAFGLGRPELLLYAAPGGLIVIARHRDNIQRLQQGTERRLGDPDTPKPPTGRPPRRLTRVPMPPGPG